MAAAHSLGMRAFADPANTPADWNFFASLGVDALLQHDSHGRAVATGDSGSMNSPRLIASWESASEEAN